MVLKFGGFQGKCYRHFEKGISPLPGGLVRIIQNGLHFMKGHILHYNLNLYHMTRGVRLRESLQGRIEEISFEYNFYDI